MVHDQDIQQQDAGSNDETAIHPIHHWAERIAFGGFCGLIFLVPLFLIPFSAIPWYNMNQPEAVSAKNSLTYILSAIIILSSFVLLLGPGWKRFRGAAMLPLIALGCYLLWGTLALFQSPEPTIGRWFWYPELALGLAAAMAPLSLYRPKRVLWVLGFGLAGSVMVALIGLISVAGYRGFYTYFYGIDPRDQINDPRFSGRVAGGVISAASASTIGNPEYAGTYSAAMAAIGAILFFDASCLYKGWKRIVSQVGSVALIGLLLTLLISTSTRQPWITLGFAALFRAMLFLGIPSRIMATGFTLVVLGAVFGGFLTAFIVLITLLTVLLVYTGIRGTLWKKLKSSDRFNLGFSLVVPIFLFGVMVAYSVPGAWNPQGLRLLQRFQSVITAKHDESLFERSIFYMVAADMVRDAPVFGIGQGRFMNEFSLVLSKASKNDETGVIAVSQRRLGRTVDDHVHNDYLEIASEKGLPSLIFFLTMILALLMHLRTIADHGGRLDRLAALMVITGLIAYLSIMTSSFPLHMPSRRAVVYVLIACALGLLASMATPRRESLEEVTAP